MKKGAEGGKLPKGVLVAGTKGLQKKYEEYLRSHLVDSKNEAFPTLSKKFSEKTRKLMAQ